MADIKVLALTLQCEIERNGDSHIRREPLPPTISSAKKPKAKKPKSDIILENIVDINIESTVAELSNLVLGKSL
jgi:hypothetical protein